MCVRFYLVSVDIAFALLDYCRVFIREINERKGTSLRRVCSRHLDSECVIFSVQSQLSYLSSDARSFFGSNQPIF